MPVSRFFSSYCRYRNLSPLDVEIHQRNNGFFLLLNYHYSLITKIVKQQIPKMRELRFGFIESMRFNARADLWCNKPIIAINAAIPTLVLNLIIAVVSNKPKLPLGNSNIVRFDESGLHTTEKDIFDFLWNNGKVLETKEGITEGIVALAVSCCSFIFLHEMVHLRNGHVDLYQSAIGLSALEESRPATSNALTPLDLRTMEWDADKIAFILSTGIALEQLFGANYRDRSLPERQNALFHYLSALTVVFKLIEFLEPKQSYTSCHPSAATRITLIHSSSARVGEMHGVEEVPRELFINASLNGEAAWASILRKTKLDFVQMARRLDEELEEIDKLLPHWNIIRERLVPFNRGITDLSRPFDL